MNKNEFKKTDLWLKADDKKKIEILEQLLEIAEEQNEKLKEAFLKEGLSKEYNREEIILRRKALTEILNKK
ncbi:hypothetical protein HYO11_18705 [Vibrio parahaemolyticus]|nr:hypothetical protein [Vibrio parahaemolyticus]